MDTNTASAVIQEQKPSDLCEQQKEISYQMPLDAIFGMSSGACIATAGTASGELWQNTPNSQLSS